MGDTQNVMQTTSAGVRSSVAVHAVILAGLLVSLAWLIPDFVHKYFDVLGLLPGPYEQAVAVSFFVRGCGLFCIPALALLLWLDWRFSRMLFRRIGAHAVGWWSALVIAALGGFTVWLFCALAHPGIELYYFHGH